MALHVKPTPPAHMPALDGLRGLAILLVLAFHSRAVDPTMVTPVHRFVDVMMMAGWVGVDLFFVLSGFLITGILLSTRESPDYYKSFFARRFLRIFPLYYLTVIVTVLLLPKAFTLPDIASLLFFYNNWTVALGHRMINLPFLWSLAVEEQFYLVWPTVVLLCSRRVLIWICGCGMALALGLRLIVLLHSSHVQAAYFLTPCRMDALLMGALLAICHRDQLTWKLLRRLALPVAISSLIGLLGIALWSGHFIDSVLYKEVGSYRHSSILIVGPGCTLLAFLFGAVLVKCTGQGWVFRVFNWNPLRRIGKYSYGMYMLHWRIILKLKHLVFTRMANRFHFAGATVISLVFLCLVVACTYVAAYISFEVFERHFLRLKRRFPAIVPRTVTEDQIRPLSV